MREILDIASMFLLLFGGLAFWPLVRFGAGLESGPAAWLKWQFHTHILALAGAFVLGQYLHVASGGAPLALHSLPYAVGALSWAAGLIILFGTGLWRRIGQRPEEGGDDV